MRTYLKKQCIQQLKLKKRKKKQCILVHSKTKLNINWKIDVYDFQLAMERIMRKIFLQYINYLVFDLHMSKNLFVKFLQYINYLVFDLHMNKNLFVKSL